MPRNASGVYSLPVASYVAGTTIKSADMNSNLSDIATALTQSLATTGVTPMTGPILAASGSLAAPSYAFASATGTGIYLSGANQIGIVTNGILAATIGATQTTFWVGAATFQSNVSVTGTLGVTGATTVTTIHATGAGTFDAAITVGTTLGVTGKATFSSTDSMALPNGTTGQRNGAPSAGDFRYNSTLASIEYYDGTNWITQKHSITVQKFTSGSGNYVPAAGVQRIRVRMCGGGGGGAAQATNNGSVGVDSSFGTWTAIHGNGGVVGSVGGTGGTGGVNGTGTLIVRFDGGKGNPGTGSYLATSGCIATSYGGSGGTNPFGGAGVGNAGVGATNTGAGGGGAQGPAASGGGSSAGSGGGGAGEYVEFWVDAPANPTAYVVGGGGNGGAAGTVAGGNGAAGIIIIEEYYH